MLMTRREFLGATALSVLGSAALPRAASLLAQAPTDKELSSPSKFDHPEIRVGMYSMSRADNFAPLLSEINAEQWKAINGGDPPQPQRIRVARLVAVFDKARGKAERVAKLYSSVSLVAKAPEDFIGHVDAVMINDDGSMRHQDQAVRYLEAGLPTWVDKLLSRDPDEAARLFALADTHRTLLLSCSLLRYAPEAAEAKKRLRSIEPLRTVHAYGPNELIYYGIHPTELCYAVLGRGVVRVQNIGERGRELVRMDYADGRRMVLEVCERSAYSFQAGFYGEKGWFTIEAKDMGAMARGLVAGFVESVRTGKAAIPREETLEIIRVLAAAEKSRLSGGVVVEIQ